MSYNYPDTITIEVKEKLEVVPANADVNVTIEGSSTFYGNEALKKSKEISKFVSGVLEIGIEEEQISVKSIAMKSSGGKLLSSSSAEFHLKINNVGKDSVPAILEQIAKQKDAKFNGLNWQYDDLESQKPQLLKTAALKSKQQAQLIAETLDCHIISVYQMEPTWTYPDSEKEYASPQIDSMFLAARSRANGESGFDLTVNMSDWLRLTLKSHYRVSEFIRS
ncbi:SIMPL domain-containing protein [Kaarinaea lacus]